MIELPEKPSPNRMSVEVLDFGHTQRGAATTRIERPGARHRIEFGFPLMHITDADKFLARFKRAKREGLQIRTPVLGQTGIPGTPVVDGADQAGTTIELRGLTAGYIGRENAWMTIVESDGTAYLHSVAVTFVAAQDGTASVSIDPPLRAPFADGDTVELGAPYMQGFIDGESYGYQIRSDKYVELAVIVEEYR